MWTIPYLHSKLQKAKEEGIIFKRHKINYKNISSKTHRNKKGEKIFTHLRNKLKQFDLMLC